MWALWAHHLPGSLHHHHHRPRHQVSHGVCRCILTVCPDNDCTPWPTLYRKRKSHVINNVPTTTNRDTPYCVCKDIYQDQSLHCLMSNATCFYFVGVLYSPVFHVFSSLSLSTTCTNLTINPFVTTNITQQTQTTHRDMRGQLLVWVSYSYNFMPAEPEPSAQDWQLTYTASVSSMPRCFMAKKLKYPYQQWKETKLEEDQDRLAPVAAKSFPGSHHRLLSA